jgi:hypothetical protein
MLTIEFVHPIAAIPSHSMLRAPAVVMVFPNPSELREHPETHIHGIWRFSDVKTLHEMGMVFLLVELATVHVRDSRGCVHRGPRQVSMPC